MTSVRYNRVVMKKPVILTGLRTNAEYHLGNYLGAILPMVELQKELIGSHQIHMFAPDLHSFTTPVEHAALFDQTNKNLRVFIAAGMPIEHPDFYLYRQSYIPAHSELTVILNNFTYVGELGRMTQFKEKAGSIKLLTEPTDDDESALSSLENGLDSHFGEKDPITVGLFDYPVLMAADILLYSAEWVPVGEDQRQHLELARTIAQRMNNRFGPLFTVPQSWKNQLKFANQQEGIRIRSLQNPLKKMSKSVDDPSGTVLLVDSPQAATQKILKAATDSHAVIRWDWVLQPGITNLLQIYQLLSGKSHEQVLDEWQGQTRYDALKESVASEVSRFLESFQQKLISIDQAGIEQKLKDSETAVNFTANETLLRVQRAVGLRD